MSDPSKDSTDDVSAESAQPEGGNKFQHAMSAWRNIDLTTLTSGLDHTASEIVAFQRDSTVQRRDLAQKTKDFRKLDDTTKLTEFKGLLKAYQMFIDLFTNHSKSVNAAFLQAYTTLSEAPDPYPLLEASVDSVLVSEETLPKVVEENQHLQSTVTQLSSQLEETDGRLQKELSKRQELEANLESRVKEVESSWIDVLAETKDNLTTREKSLEEKIEHQDRLLVELRASYEVNQRLGKNDEKEDTHHGKASMAELEMLRSDLERTSSRLADVEARNEQLRRDLAQAKSTVPSHSNKALEDEPLFVQIRAENSSLIRKHDAVRLEKDALKRDLDSRLRSLERQIELLNEEKETLKAKVLIMGDYDEIKQELDVLKSIEFSTGYEDETRERVDAASDKEDTLEKLLMSRNKKLNEELTILRVSHQNLQARLRELEEDLSRAKAELETPQQLKERLENDLERMQSEGANVFPSAASVAGTYVTRAATRKGRISPTSSIISGIDPRGALGEREPMGGGSGILPMITAQRDHFRQKNAQLEQEMSATHRTVQQLRQEVAALQKDNLNLYEKTRYISTYSRGGATASSSSAYAANPNPSTIAVGGATSPDSSIDRYRKTYESNLSPFAAFRGRESARAYRRMSYPERVVFVITRVVLASRTSRNLFAAYCVALHVIVFLSLYWLGSADFDKHASHLGSSAAALAAEAAAQGPVRDGSAGHGGWEDGFHAR